MSKFSAKLIEGDSPKEFLRKHRPPAQWKPGSDPTRQVEDYRFDNYGVENSQYWQGVSTVHTTWDDVYVGVGDTPQEAGEDAVSQASEDYDVDHIENNLPQAPSAADELTNQCRAEAEREIQREDYETDEDYQEAIEDKTGEFIETYDSNLYCYVVLWIKNILNQHESLAEADEAPSEPEAQPGRAKAFIKGLRNLYPPNWPTITRWRKDYGGNQMRRAYQQGVRGNVLNTKFLKYPRPGEYALRYYNTDVLYYDGYGNTKVRTGGYRTKTTRERINMFAPHGWAITQYQYGWYWINQNWPAEIEQQIFADMRARRQPRSRYWIPFSDGDYIDARGTLHFNAGGGCWATPSGEIERHAQVHEGRYLDKLAKFKRMQAKFDKMREVKKRIKEVEDIDKPEKQEEGQAKDFLLKVGAHRKLAVGEEVIHGTSNSNDIIEACLDKLKETDTRSYVALNAEYRAMAENDNAVDEFLYERLEPVMQKLCPPLTYFGSHPGDGSRLGCWPFDDATYQDMAESGRIAYGSLLEGTADSIIEGNLPENVKYGIVYKEYYSYTCYDRQGHVVWDY